MAGSDEIELVADAANGSPLNLAMKIETGGDDTVANEDELTEEGTATFLNVVLDLLAS